MTLATSVTSPKSQTAGKKVLVEVLHLDDIPGAMDKMGWKISARMMRRWFAAQPAYIMNKSVRGGATPPNQLSSSQYDDQIIKMDWVLSFPRCVQPFEDLVMNWHSPAGLRTLKTRLQAAGWAQGSSATLGSVTMTAIDLEVISQVNFTRFGAKLDTLDDMYGAIGNAAYKIAVVGKTRYSPTGDIFEIDKLGVYVRDTYDFNDDGAVPEPLGVWNKERCLSKAETIEYLALSPAQIYRTFQGFVPVFNGDFRRWQKAHNSGGDFVVYSDVKWVEPPISWVKIP
jgi:hypothetical protein